jgi:hypothetical protein
MADQERHGKAFDLDRPAAELAGSARTGLDAFDMADRFGSAVNDAGADRLTLTGALESGLRASDFIV